MEAARILDLDRTSTASPSSCPAVSDSAWPWGGPSCGSPQVFLMDEPLSNLDAKLRVQTRAELADLQARLGVTTVYVTHDQVEAMTMGQRVAILDYGVMQQCERRNTLYRYPANLFVAGFIGSPAMNLVEVGEERPLRGWGSRSSSLDSEAQSAVSNGRGEQSRVGFRPEALRLGRARYAGRSAPSRTWGSEVFVHVALDHRATGAASCWRRCRRPSTATRERASGSRSTGRRTCSAGTGRPHRRRKGRPPREHPVGGAETPSRLRERVPAPDYDRRQGSARRRPRRGRRISPSAPGGVLRPTDEPGQGAGLGDLRGRASARRQPDEGGACRPGSPLHADHQAPRRHLRAARHRLDRGLPVRPRRPGGRDRADVRRDHAGSSR